MEVKLEVLISRSIKRKKPCSRFCWLGQEKESVFLLDDNNLSEINLVSGRIKKKVARLQPLLKNKYVAVLATSRNGAWLAGALTSGEIFIWSKDQDVVKTIALTEELSNEIAASEESCRRLYLFVSGDGRRLLLATTLGGVFVWESTDIKNVPSSWKGHLSSGRWSRIDPGASTVLPGTDNKEAAVHAIFVRNQTLGDCCLCSFAFYTDDRLMLVFLVLRWHENAYQYISSLPYDVHWSHQECSLSSLVPSCTPVKSKGALVTAFAGDGLVLAASINQKDPKATQVLFVNTLNFVTISGSLKGCSSKNHMIPTKFIRSYWVSDMSWTPDSLFLACILKRGALVLLTRMGDLLSLVTSGCSVEFGPAEFIPLHPLITYRSSDAALQTADANSSLGSTTSEKDVMRQRFSVTAHPRSPYLIVSDGYMVTALRFVNNHSPPSYMKSLLLDSAQTLESMHQFYCPSKHHKGKRPKLRSLSSLKANILKHQESQNSTFSMIPRFLQSDEEMLELRLAELQGYEEDSEDEVLSKDGFTSFSFKPDSSGKSVDQGRLEFASMFDTIHAADDTDEMDDEGNVFTKLNCIQKKLMAAWSLGISFGTIEEKGMLLNWTVGVLTHLINVLQFSKYPPSTKDKFSRKTVRNSSWVHCVFKVFQQCLTVLRWDVPNRQGFRHMIKLTYEVVKLIIHQQDQPFSRTLMEAFSLLKMVSYYLNIIYTPQCDIISASAGKDSSVELDSLFLPLCQNLFESNVKDFSFMDDLCSLPPRASHFDHSPDKRLTFLWRLLYQQALRFQAQLCLHVSRNDSQLKEKINDEESSVAVILCHIQATLQSSGDTLEKAVRLKPVTGEEHFLLGSYKESVHIWKRALQENTAPEGKRACFLQMRYFLAMLYCHLYHNNLSEAQGLCDQLTRELLRQSRLPFDQMEDNSESPRTDDFGLLSGVHVKAALTVVQSMARFMASYFTNQPLYVLPPHNVNILPPLHIRPEKFPRVVPLQHCTVANAVRDQNLSSVWTVEYALDLLLIGGLIPEAAWFALQLGDWKMSVSIGLAYNLFCQITEDLTWLNSVEMHLPPKMTPAHTFQEKLQSFLGRPASSEIIKVEGTDYKQFTDPIEEEDADALFSSVQEMLKAAVMAEADILSETFLLLIEAAKDLSKGLSDLVPEKLYLPAPLLYCPQPASVSEGDYGDQVLTSEKDYRQKVSGVLQRILLLLRAARCSLPSAQWYIKKLKWARKVMQKIRAKCFLLPLSQLPESLLNYSRTNSTFKPGPGGDKLDDVSCKIIGSFRELCALCWMLHVREKLSDGCRCYQIARDSMEKQQDFDKKVPFDSTVVEQCLNALEWAYRMLPFSAFLNIEELVQDIILSLIGELPPVQKVAEILVKAFPSSEAVRVPLRDKYHSLQQRLRHCMVKGPKGEEMMSVVMHNIHKVRIKTLKRVVRNIGPIEVNIWEPEEEAPDNEALLYDRFSMGTSLSRSTLTEFGKPQVYSDADTGDTLSEALMTEEPVTRIEMPVTEDVCYNNDTLYRKKDISAKTKIDKKEPKENTSSQNVLPSVGTWEFERDDDEYIAFLDVFLSYLLERDLINYTDPCIPFLTSFSENLREFELNSLLFDIHTTLKRRQGRSKRCCVFRAGYSYTFSPETGEQPVDSDPSCEEKGNGLHRLPSNPTSLIVPSSKPSRINYFYEDKKAKMGKKGLFGLNLRTALQEEHQEVSSACPKEPHHSTETPVFVNTFKRIHFESVLPSEELLADLKSKFGSISRLLEWMIRWSDKQLLCGSYKEELICKYSTRIRVKTSALAILTALWLLEERHSAEYGDKNTNVKIPDAEFIIAPVLQPVERQNIQRESSVDTGYRGSTGTPIDALEENLHEDTCESDSESSPIHELKNELEEVQGIQQKAFDIQSASEDDFEDGFDLVSPSISVSIRPIQRLTENSVETFEIPHRESESEMLEEKKMHHDSTCASDFPSSPALVRADMKVSTSSQPPVPALSDGPSSPTKPVLDAQNMQSHAAINTSPPDTQDREHRTQPQNLSEAVRQMFQDEMFQLLQLQQINFMSLMQIVGSSFANLPHMQQLIQQSQPIHLQGVQTSDALRGLVTEGLPTTPAEDGRHLISVPHVQQPHTMKSDAERPNNTSNSDQPEVKSLPDESNKENRQDRTDLKPEESRSRMRLATCSMFDTVNGKDFPLLNPSIDGQCPIPPLVTVPHNLNAVNGFPLLHLSPENNFKPEKIDTFRSFARPPQKQLEAWVTINTVKNRKESERPEYSSGVVQPNVNQHVKPYEQREQLKRSAESVKTEHPKHLNLNPYMLTSNRASQLQNLKHAVAPALDSQVSSQGAYCNQAGFPLLHMQVKPVPLFPPIIRPNNAALLVPPRCISRKDIQVPQQIPKLTLLRASIPLESKVISQALPFQPPRLVPLKNIIDYYQGIQNKSQQLFREPIAGSIQLLKANIEPFEQRDVKRESKGRLRRRVEKQHKQEHIERLPDKQDNMETTPEKQVQINAELEGQEGMKIQPGNQEKIEIKAAKKPSVSFRPEDSIIKLIPVDDNSSYIIDKSEVHQNDVPSLEHGEGFVLPLGMFDSLLLEQNNKHGLVPAPAELHYLAATRKKAAEIQDASTNTDPEYLPSMVPQLLPPDLYQNLRFLNALEEKIVPSKTFDPETVLPEHQYINVIDIEASDFLKDLPTRESKEEEMATDRDDGAPAPSSAQLHHMAASVTNAVPPDEFESTDYLLQLPVPQSQNLIGKSGGAGDSVTWNLLQDDVDIVKPTGRSVNTLSANTMSKVRIDSKLQEMEAQLSALQNMAQDMERDFATSELLVNTIENLGSAMDSGHEEMPYTSKGIRDTEKELFLNRVGLEDVFEEEEEESKSEFIAYNASAWQTPAFSAMSAANLASTIETSADLPRVEEVRESFSDAPLEMTGLSDIADIIGDLVRDGGVAASELGLTETQARIFSRASDAKANSARLTKKPESKRQEIREWMKIKQKERLAEHRKKQEELREREHDPFRPHKDLQRTLNSRDIRKIQKAKEEKDKTLLSEHHSHRVAQAVTLMNDIISGTSQAPATNPNHPPNSPLRLRPPQSVQGQPLTSPQRVYSSKRSLSANSAEKKRTISRTRSLSTPSNGSTHSRGPWALPKKIPDSRARAQSATNYSLKTKLEISLPRDRMSQITRRGILVNRNTKKLHAHIERREKPAFDSKRPVSANPDLAYDRSGREIFRKPTKQAAVCQTDDNGLENEDSDSLSHWEVPDEINRILNSSQNAWSLLQEEEHSPQSLNDIDNMSESTGSILSKLDWNMIEDMVASVEDKCN